MDKLEANMQHARKHLAEKLNELAVEALKLKELIKNSKTLLKKQYYTKKLSKNSDKAARVIVALSYATPKKADKQEELSLDSENV